MRARAKPVAPGTIYTCPMHPEIRQVGPGSCPICGMALEPLEVSADQGPNPELVDMTRRFWIGVGADRARRSCSRWAAISLGLRPSDAARLGLELGPAGAGDAGGAVGGLAVLRARLALARDAQPQHVHADRAWAPASPGSTASSRRCCPASSPPRSQGTTARSPSTSRRPPSSPCWCCSGQVLELRARESDRRRHPGAARPGAEDRARASRPTDGSDEKCRSTQVVVGDRLARAARARRCRSTARSSRAAAPSTNRW